MNDAQSLTTTGGSQLSQTQNPQAVGGQSLVTPRNDLQVAPGSVLSSSRTIISSVGSSQFNPVTQTSPTTSTAVAPNNDFSAKPYLIGMAVVLLFFAALVFVAVTRGSQTSTKK